MQMLSILPLDEHLVSRRDQGLAEGLVWQRTSLSSVCVCSEGDWLTSWILLSPPQPAVLVLGSSGLWSCDPLSHVRIIFPASINFIWPSRSRRRSYFSFWLTIHISATATIISQQSHYWGPSTVVRVSTITFNWKPEMFSDCKRPGHSLLLGVELEL